VSGPIRIQLSRRKGWRMPPNTVKVDRGTIYGNPFPLSYFGGDRKACVARFRELAEAPPLRGLASSLRGKNVACWCPLDEPCHGDVWLELANGGIAT
jgi:hypothetical protein